MTVIMHTEMPEPAVRQAAATSPAFYAGFWRRLVAAGIDGMIILVLVVGLSVAAGVSVGQVNGTPVISKDGRSIPLSDIAKPQVVVTRDGPQTTTIETTTATVGLQTVYSVVTRTTIAQTGAGQPRTSTIANLTLVPSPLALALLFVFWLFYASVFESSRLRGSLGKRAMFIRVADEEGRRVTLLRALGRNALKLVSAIPLCVGYLMAGWTAKKQSLHDILAGCTVEVALR